jgi:hypothetical protein
MTEISRRNFMTAASVLGSAAAAGAFNGTIAEAANGFMAASSNSPGGDGDRPYLGPGIQGIYALCEVTGGGQKVYGIAVEYDAKIDSGSLALNTYSASVFPTARGFFPGMPEEPDKNATTEAARPRAVVAIYTKRRTWPAA